MWWGPVFICSQEDFPIAGMSVSKSGFPRYPCNVFDLFAVQNSIMLLITVVLFGIKVFALIDCVTRSESQFHVHDALPKRSGSSSSASGFWRTRCSGARSDCSTSRAVWQPSSTWLRFAVPTSCDLRLKRPQTTTKLIVDPCLSQFW